MRFRWALWTLLSLILAATTPAVADDDLAHLDQRARDLRITAITFGSAGAALLVGSAVALAFEYSDGNGNDDIIVDEGLLIGTGVAAIITGVTAAEAVRVQNKADSLRRTKVSGVYVAPKFNGGIEIGLSLQF